MKVRYSPRACRDLEATHEFLSSRSPKGAANVLAAIYAAIEFVRRNPESTQTTRIPNVRAMVVRRYRFKIFYRVIEADKAIEIVHVRHTSRRSWWGAND
jgi:toxin ParE1/3/4